MKSGGDFWHVKGDVWANKQSFVNCVLWCLLYGVFNYMWLETFQGCMCTIDAVGHFQFTVEYLEYSFEQ